MKLLVDDIRTLEGMDAIARTAMEAKSFLASYDYTWSVLYMDHDLGEGENGNDILIWAGIRNLLPPEVVLVTGNPVGARNMEYTLKDFGYTKNNYGVWFRT